LGVYIGYNRYMGILDNFENYLELEPTEQTENDGLALKIFKEECCDNCNCKN
jgi:NADH:ubiquinone oxidoreductase subunit E